MSGGHFDYIYLKIEEIAKELNPKTSESEIELGLLLSDLSKVLYELEMYKSGDNSLKEFEEEWEKFKEEWLK
jgi:hypothetical protein